MAEVIQKQIDQASIAQQSKQKDQLAKRMLGSQFGSKSFGAGLVKGLEKNSVKAKKEQNKKKSKVQMMMN